MYVRCSRSRCIPPTRMPTCCQRAKPRRPRHGSCWKPVQKAASMRAGTVHSLGGDVVVFEVQQNSDVTFRLYDWDHVDPKTGKPRALQVDKAMACVDFSEGPVGWVT